MKILVVWGSGALPDPERVVILTICFIAFLVLITRYLSINIPRMNGQVSIN